jgi:SAM-dependent methyltransferase
MNVSTYKSRRAVSVSEDREGYKPFDLDVQKRGAYRYTNGSKLGARIANERYTQMILSATDFRDKSVVDVGSGDGTYTTELAARCGARSILGIEPSPKASERASSLYDIFSPRLQFRCASSETLLSEEKKFDIAIYRGVIHHVTDPRGELQRASTLARTVIILEPNGLNPLMKLVEKSSSYHRQHRERSFAPKALIPWITERGGSVTKITFFGLVPYFCPDIVARAGHLIEPQIESIPWLRSLCCGQYLLVYGGKTI